MSEISDQRIPFDGEAASDVPEVDPPDYEATLPEGVEQAAGGVKEDTLLPEDPADVGFGELIDDTTLKQVPDEAGAKDANRIDADQGSSDGEDIPDALIAARHRVDEAFAQQEADDEGHDRAQPPRDGDGDDGGSENDESPESGDDDEENVRLAYSRFRENIAALKTSVATLEDPSTHPDYVGRTGTDERPGALIFRVGDRADTSGEKQYETRLVPDGDDEVRASERGRYTALMRARQIDDPAVRADLEHLEAYGADDEQIVTRIVQGDRLDDLLPEDKGVISDDNIRSSLETIEAMVTHGIVPSTNYGDTVVVHPETGQLQFKDYVPIEEADVDADRPILVTTDCFMDVADYLYEPGVRDRETREASDRFQESSQHALKEHYLYKRPYVAYVAEELDPDVIRALYAHTAPSRRSTTHDLHVASQMHELALQGQGRDMQARLDALGDAHEAYEMVVFQQVFDRKGDLHHVLREDERGRNPLLINDHFLQARMALACWPASEARIRGEELSPAQRHEINWNLSEVIQQMMPGDEPPRASHARETSFSGFLTEVVAMTALSRFTPDVDTSLALPTSEVRRLYGGPDAMIIFDDGDGEAALDEDWKLGVSRGPDTVSVGNICYGIASKLEDKPYAEEDRRAQKVWKSVAHVATLLRDEGLDRRRLTADEVSILNQVQGEIWGTITGKASRQLGIDNLRGRARF